MNAPLIPAVHASAVQTDGGALIFLGPSGAGKSTICELLSGYAPQIAADVVYLVPGPDGRWGVADGGRRAYEGPLSAEEATALRAIPLRAIFRLFQAPTSRLRPLGGLETCRYLTDALFEVAWQRDYDLASKKGLFAHLAAVCRTAPGYELYFDLSLAVGQLLAVALQRKEENRGREAKKDRVCQTADPRPGRGDAGPGWHLSRWSEPNGKAGV